jgi:uncharacterized protein
VKRLVAGCAAVLLALGVSACHSAAVGGNEAVAPATVPLTVHSSSGKHRFRVEVARTADEQAKGLMFRESMAPDAGMIFPMVPPRDASFWMKNTLIPLDMIFIRADGTIARIEPNTVPHSLEPVASGEPVAAVFEIAGGRAAELGIAEGDRVVWEDRAKG